ncbi:MAG: glycosyltransferase, partial [Ignavibacteriales bacterium]|nr:glycosyltransferase [Ignavibacteriales bacterium]
NDKVGIYFSACDVVVLPYISATQSGIVQIAYQFDKPVIATNVGGLAEVVLDGKTGYIVPPEQPQALASAVIQFYEERRETEFVSNVKAEKKKYSWEALVIGIEELVNL